MRTAIYCRVSGARQKDNTSLPEQERIGREKAASLGWEISEAHVYREVMGGEDLYRPEMDRLWEAIMRHEIDGVVIDVLDRLSRDEGDQGAFYHHCDRYGVTVEIASEDIDETENGRNLRTLAGMVARMERVDIRRRTQRGRRARAAEGKLFPPASHCMAICSPTTRIRATSPTQRPSGWCDASTPTSRMACRSVNWRAD